MDNFVVSFIKDNKPQIKKYSKYFKENDWGEPDYKKDNNGDIISSKYYYVKDVKEKIGGSLVTTHEGKEPEYKIQDKITKTVLSRLKYFHGFVEADIGKSTKVNSMIKSMVDLIESHTKRVDKYIRSNDALEEKNIIKNSEKTQKDYQSDEIEFDNLLYKDKAKITDDLNKLDLDQKKEKSLLELKDDAKAPLSMRKTIEEEFPNIKEYVESLGINFNSPPKNEMFVNIENPPEWDTKKHYFEQDKDVLQFYVDEFKKIKSGIIIKGVHISGWLYCHLNVFKAPIPVEVENNVSGELFIEDQIINPKLRDNEWFIIQQSYKKATEENRMMFLCATRRAAKTTLIDSYLQYKALSGGKTLVVAGGSGKDLGHIEKGFKITMTNAHPAFYIPNISNDWSKSVKLGMKKKNQRDILVSTLDIYNLDSGAETKSELLAGLTPDAFVLDECMKSPFKDQLDAALPAFETHGKMRFTPILSGTGGNESLAKDAIQILKDPNKYQVSEMDWDALEENIPKEYITWKRRKFATYLPGQMSTVASDLRIKSNLSEYLGIESKGLQKIEIYLTDWAKTKERFEKRREDKEHDKKSLYKEKVYFPLDPEDILLSGDENPFPKEALRRYRDKIIEEGDIGKNVVLFYNDSTQQVTYELTKKEVAEFPYNGGFHDSPVTIYEDPLPNAPFEFNILGLDDYKQEQADSDSVGSFVVVRRDTGKVVATYHSRPDPHGHFHEQGSMLCELYNAPVFMENEDMGFKEYMDRRDLTDEYILKSVDFLGDVNFDYNLKRKYGWQPTSKNKNYLFGIAFNTLTKKEDYTDENGRVRQRYAFERLLKDIRILDEMINYKKGGNFDGLTALMSAYGYDYYLQVTGQAPQKPLTEEEKRIKEEVFKANKLRRMKRQKNPFPNTSRAGRYW